MSVEALSWAFARQDIAQSGAKFLLVALANHADKSGVTYIGHDALAADCTCRRETVGRNMAVLEDAGFVVRFQRRRANGSRTSDWTVLAPRHGERGPMSDANPDEYPGHVAEVARALTPPRSADGSLTAQVPPKSSHDQGAKDHVRKAHMTSLRIGGKPVEPEAWQKTEAALAAFNEIAGKSLGLLDGRGQPSETAKRIYGRAAAHPELDASDHRRIIASTLESRWWGAGPPSVGVIYGPKVWDENVAGRAPAQPSKRDEARAAKARRSARGRAAIQRLTGGG